MNKLFNFLFTVLIGAGFWLLFTYIFYKTLEPIRMTILLAIVFGVGMWVIEIVFHKKKK